MSQKTQVQRLLESIRAIAPSGFWLTAWLYLYLVAVLATWVAATWLLTPWSPVVVTSGSMAPSIRAGDLVFVAAPADDLISQNSVITFRDLEGELVTHRVFAVEDDHVVTKGDANEVPDTDPVALDQIAGIGRMVVPLVGLPVAWWLGGWIAPVVAWIVLTVIVAGFTLNRTVRLPPQQAEDRRPGANVTQKAVRQVRVLVALMILAQYVIDPNRLQVTELALNPSLTLVITIAVLLITNYLSAKARESGNAAMADRASAIELTIDTILVIGLATATGTSGIGWVLFALPIVEAAVRFRLGAALLHWVLLTATTIGLLILTADVQGLAPSQLLEELERLIDQLSVLLLVVIPAAYLAEQLVIDVVRHRTATGRAQERSELLQQVVDLGRQVTKLDRSLLDTLADAALSLGFARADIAVRFDGSQDWTVVAQAGNDKGGALPVPGMAGSGLRDQDLAESAVVVDGLDPETDERVALRASGWSTIVRVSIPNAAADLIALRAVLASDEADRDDRVDALTLLVGQASVSMENNRLVDELRALNERVQHEASHDALTGLANRSRLLKRLSTEVETAAVGNGVGLLFLDLNGFKPVNDRLGHDVGDELLCAVAGRMERLAGEFDLVVRLGGDEFTVLMSGLADRSEMDPMVHQLIETISQPFALTHEKVRISTSLGVAFTDSVIEPAELIRQADVAMYQAKGDKVDPVRRYEPAMDMEEHRRAKLSVGLDQAMETGALHLRYQPIVTSGRNSRLVGMETLLRWEHPEFGRVSPGETIEVAENAGRAADLNRWILTRACQDAVGLMNHPAVNNDDLFLTVNASPVELQLSSLAGSVEAALDVSGLPATSLLIELSERLSADEDALVSANLERLTALGVQVVLDDFGQGRTALAHLRRLDLAGIKLDRKLLLNAVDREEDRIVVVAIVDLAHKLGISVIAEGVETAEHKVIADTAGVDFLQGYFCGQPKTPAEFVGETEPVAQVRPAARIEKFVS
ncbi:MAG: signal peptidase I [Acidimicrobiales bacterium]